MTRGTAIILLLSAALLLPARAPAQGSTVYATVVATKLFVVGAANPRTGLHFRQASGDTGWRQMGPKTIRAFHTSFFGPARGRVIYIGAGNGVHKSSDGGATWRVTTGWEITEVLWTAPDQTDSNIVYCATEFGIFRTVDGCATWRKVSAGLATEYSTCVIIDRSDPRRLYCATESGVFCSDDRGDHWRRLGLSVGGIRVVAQHPRDPLILIAGTEEHGIYVSRDGGRIWTKAEAGVDHTTFYAFAFDPQNPDVVYAGGYVTGVYKSTDGARSWRRMNDGLTALSIHSIAVDPNDSNRVFAAAYWGGVFRTDNGGKHWTHLGLTESCTWTITVEPF